MCALMCPAFPLLGANDAAAQTRTSSPQRSYMHRTSDHTPLQRRWAYTRGRRTDLYPAATQTARTCRNAHPCPPSWAQDGRTLHDTLPPLYTDLCHCIIPCPPFLAGRAPNMHGAVRPRTAATCCTMPAPPRLSPPLAEHKPRCGTDFDSHTTVATTQRAPNRKLPQCIRGIRLQRRITASHRHTDVHAHTLPHQHAVRTSPY